MSNKLLKRSFISLSPEKDIVPKKVQKLSMSSLRNIENRNSSRLNLNKTQTVTKNDEIELFNFKQIKKICYRELQDRNDKLREEYESSLKTKLAEQYDTFIKFTFDQILKRSAGENGSSYLS